MNRLLIGNKCDIESQKSVSTEEGKQLAESLGIPFMETSAKNSLNVEQSFLKMATEIKSRVAVSTSKPNSAAARGQQLSSGKAISGKKNSGCC